jgi:RNA polymerase sigma-70 factor (ECF subfamily)
MSNSPADSFAALLRPHLPKLFRLACRLTNTTADAEDLVQDVLVKLFGRRSELSSIRDLPPWLGRVLYNQFIDDVRRYGRQPLKLVDDGKTIDELPDHLANPELVATQISDSRSITQALAKLSEDHRAVLVLHDVEGYTIKEVEELTGTAQGTLKSRLHRARQRLRELLKKDGTNFAQASCTHMNGDNVDAL